MRLKTKLSISLIFLFFVILLFGVLGVFYINKLGDDVEQILKNNQESLVYCNNMLRALEDIKSRKDAMQEFSENLHLQQNNITEAGEKEATEKLTASFKELLEDPGIRPASIRRSVQPYIGCWNSMKWRF